MNKKFSTLMALALLAGSFPVALIVLARLRRQHWITTLRM